MNEVDENEINEAFQEPKKKFWQRSSRKRTKSDVISVSSMDISLDSTIAKRKKRRRITELASSFLAASTTGRLSNVLQRSFGFHSNTSVGMIDEDGESGPSKRTRSKCEQAGNVRINSWVTDISTYSPETLNSNLSRNDIKKQEAIYELYCGENVLLNDLQELKESYLEPLQSTDIFTPSELRTLFGDLDMLIHVHSKLRDDLIELRDSRGFTSTIGPTILEWLSTLTEPYVERCRTQIMARHLLETKRMRSKKFQEFIKKKMESPRAVDLWTYLDVARSRIVKYPLLINEILRRTPPTHEDYLMLKEASVIFSEMLEKIDQAMGDAECDLARMKIIFKTEYDSEGLIKSAKELITEGQLKDPRGLKLHCFLFDTCFAVTRPIIKSRLKNYDLYYPVIAKDQFLIADAASDGDNDDSRLKIADRILIVRDEHDKKHWIDAFKKAKRLTKKVSKKSIDSEDKPSEESASRVLRDKQFPKRTTRERPI
ncbi:rho guanine nucleotide exchange factor 3-like [Microplitis demolitor]|uniref:rho guanine nucleotide exchange factor 3-like n=1 Tax=Microplitis demolitor TaxID=69319 RepID=UPI0004CCAE5C|nr:rho guanine nucleotide exchange factor 3-like [Microplitis demolitor]